MINNDAATAQLVAEMRRMAAAAGADNSAGAAGVQAAAEPADFSAMLKRMVDQVNEAQSTSAALSQDFALGNQDVDLAEVMVAMQKARVHFETMLQVRNRLVRAYEDIMRMPV